MSHLAKGYLTAIVGVAIWSTTGVFISYLLTHYQIPALLLALWRNLLVCAALVPALFLIRRSLLRLDPAHIRFYVFYGLVLAVFNSIWAISVRENGAAVATVLGYSSAGYTAIIAFFLFHEKLGPAKITAIVLSLAGCVMVANAYRLDVWNLNRLGVFTGLGSGVLFAVYTLSGKEAARREINVWTSLFVSFAFSAPILLVFNLLPALPGAAGSLASLAPKLPLDGWLVLAFLSFGPTLLGFGLYNGSMNYLPASVTNLLATTEPAMTAVQAYFFLHERMTVIQILGSVTILSAVLIVRRENQQ